MSSAKVSGVKIIVAIGIVVGAIALVVPAATAGPDSITWERDYQKAVERAQAGDKRIVAYMFTDWCLICKRMDAETFTDTEMIQSIADEYVWLKLNTETEEDGRFFQKEFAIVNYPTVLLLDKEGKEIDRTQRFLYASEFGETMQSFLESPDSLANLRRAVQEKPDSVAARYALAQKLLNQNNFVKASAEFEKVVEMDPENHEGKTEASRYNIALCLASQFRYEEALAQLDLLETSFPDSKVLADAAVLRGQLYHCCGNVDKAQAILQEFVQKYPTHGHIELARRMLAQMQAATAGR
jgi:tetratricopeptide (TPR) repeat protein